MVSNPEYDSLGHLVAKDVPLHFQDNGNILLVRISDYFYSMLGFIWYALKSNVV